MRSQKHKEKGLVPDLRFPEFRDMGEWQAKYLGKVSNVLRGGSPRPIGSYLTKDPGGLNWLKIGDVDKESKFITHTEEKVKKTALNKTREVHPGDLIMSNSMSFGRPYILKIQSCIHDGWIAITELDGVIVHDYLYYFILSNSAQSYFVSAAAGGGIKNLNADIIKLLLVCFPKQKKEQQKIADCLSSIDALITVQVQKLDALKAHKKGLMQQLFPAPGETIPKSRFPEFRDSGEWEYKNLGDIGKVSMCKRIIKHETSETGNIPFYKIGTFGKLADAYISKELYNRYREKFSFPKKGDILISASGTIGRTVVYDGSPSYFQDSNIVWLDNDEKLVLNSFLAFVYQMIKWVTNDNTIARLYNDNLRRIEIEIPSLPEQQKIADSLSSIDALITAQSQKLDVLKSHKKGLMQQLFPSPKSHVEVGS